VPLWNDIVAARTTAGVLFTSDTCLDLIHRDLALFTVPFSLRVPSTVSAAAIGWGDWITFDLGFPDEWSLDKSDSNVVMRVTTYWTITCNAAQSITLRLTDRAQEFFCAGPGVYEVYGDWLANETLPTGLTQLALQANNPGANIYVASAIGDFNNRIQLLVG
jgi:hypothetical protein